MCYILLLHMYRYCISSKIFSCFSFFGTALKNISLFLLIRKAHESSNGGALLLIFPFIHWHTKCKRLRPKHYTYFTSPGKFDVAALLFFQILRTKHLMSPWQNCYDISFPVVQWVSSHSVSVSDDELHRNIDKRGASTASRTKKRWRRLLYSENIFTLWVSTDPVLRMIELFSAIVLWALFDSSN